MRESRSTSHYTDHQKFNGNGNLNVSKDFDFFDMLLVEWIEHFLDHHNGNDRADRYDQRGNVRVFQVPEYFDVRLQSPTVEQKRSHSHTHVDDIERAGVSFQCQAEDVGHLGCEDQHGSARRVSADERIGEKGGDEAEMKDAQE